MNLSKKEIEEILDKGIIQPFKSSWSYPIVLVPKKNGKVQICIDYYKLINTTMKDVYPLPNIDNIFNSLDNAQWFSTLDMISDYWQVAVSKKDKPKSAFDTKFGLFEFNAMIFGFCNAPATFQWLMNYIITKYIDKFVVVYLEDLTVYFRSFDDYIKYLEIIFNEF